MSNIAQIEKPYDVVIVGGGPAGSSVAINMACFGRKILIVEREDFPRYHIGESVGGETDRLLRLMGLGEYLDNAGFPVKRGVTVYGQTDRSKFFVPVQTMNDDGEIVPKKTWQIRRAEFDKKLLDTAIERGAEHMRAQALNVIQKDGRVTGLRVKNPSGKRTVIPAKMIVDASGQSCFLGKQNLLGGKITTGYEKQVALFAYAKGVKRNEGKNSEDTNIFYSRKDHWSWLIPFNDEVTSLGIVVPDKSFKDSDLDKEEFFRFCVETLNPFYRDKLADIEYISDVSVVRNFSYRYEKICGPGYMSIGDAHAFLDPIFAFGVHFALKEGLLATKEIEAYLDNPEYDFTDYVDMVENAHNLVRLSIDTFWHYPLAFLRLAHFTHVNDIAYIFSGRLFTPVANDLEAVQLMQGLFQDKSQCQTKTPAKP